MVTTSSSTTATKLLAAGDPGYIADGTNRYSVTTVITTVRTDVNVITTASIDTQIANIQVQAQADAASLAAAQQAQADKSAAANARIATLQSQKNALLAIPVPAPASS